MKHKTLVNFILDKSGSMDSIKESTISGFNEYLKTLQKDEKSEYEFTLTLFDTRVDTVCKEKAIRSVSRLNSESYKPNGNTALYDAVCQTIRGTKIRRGQTVINVIMTDGEENASTQYTEKDMQLLVHVLENQGNWSFVYLGANQDSFAKAAKFGFNPMNVSNFNATGTGVVRAMSMMASNTSAFVASASSNGGLGTANFFSKKDQDELSNVK